MRRNREEASRIHRRALLKSSVAGAVAFALPFAGKAFAQTGEKVLRVAMTVSDVPLTTGAPSQGTEGLRFMGITVYDGLVRWDLSKADEAAKLVPGLAESWTVDEQDTTRWTFRLRQGVKFHDGSEFNADAVVWNLEKLMKKDAPHFDQAQSTQAAQYYGGIDSWSKVDDYTVEIRSKRPDSVLIYNLANLFFSSPARWKELGGSWEEFAFKASGTGPWIVDKFVPRERIELVRNKNYWDPGRIPKCDRLVLLPMPDPNTRIAALLAGQVDFVEAPPPDAIPRLRASGMQIVTNQYPHIWCYEISAREDSPFGDVRVRQAANLAIDRDGLVKLLGGLAVPAKGMVTEGHPWFGKPNFDLRYDPEEAKRLLAEAGYGPEKPAQIKVIIAPSGSGQMQPIPMNEYIKENFAAVGIDMEFEVLDWESLRGRRRAGAAAPENEGRDGVNNSWAFWDPDIALLKTAASYEAPPTGYNWGNFSNPEVDELVKKAKETFDQQEQDKILADIHSRIVDEAMWIWMVHDLNPRALSPKVEGFVQAQSWLQDLTSVEIS